MSTDSGITHNGSTPILAIDAMGGDHGPAEVVAGIALALSNDATHARIVVVGDQAVLEKALSANGLKGDARIELVHASEVIGMDEKPITALKQKKDSSMVRAIELVKEGRAHAILSLGNTGALMAGGTLRLRPMAGIDRPALATVIPSRKSKFVMIDVGANPESDPLHLLHNALLGTQYARCALGIARPRVGLMTIGTEENKGTARILESNEMLKNASSVLHYVGPIEGFQLFRNEADVVVCDGFTGNILLKSLESCYDMLKGFLKEELMANPMRKAGAFLSRGAYMALKDELNPEVLGGAPLLGLNRLVIKAHGSSNRAYVAGAIRVALEALSHDLTGAIRADLDKLAATMPVTGTDAVSKV